MDKEKLKSNITGAIELAGVSIAKVLTELANRLGSIVDDYECTDEIKDPIKDGVVLELPEGLMVETNQLTPGIVEHAPFNRRVGNNRWMSETFNGVYFGTNAWGFGGNAGGTQKLIDGFVQVGNFGHNESKLYFRWFVGGYHRDFNGKPGEGWWNAKGGNNVKAYPRVGIGSASGQEVATSGAPFNVPCKVTDGWKHVDQFSVLERLGVPIRIRYLRDNIYINIKYEMKNPNLEVLERDRYGNYFLAVDSYLHDLSKENVARESLADLLEGINDTSGTIYNQPMSGLPNSTKEWAVMIWLCKSPYFETSGGVEIDMIEIDDFQYIVKYKIEKASDKDFKYVSFTRNIEAKEAVKGDVKIHYNIFLEYLTSKRFQTALDEAQVKDVGGGSVKSPSEDLVVSDINFGIEVLSNPDTPENKEPHPISCEFDELSFKVGDREFGYRR